MRRKIVIRKKEKKFRKSFLPTFVITVLLWTGTFGIVYFIDPYKKGAIPLVFTAILFALFFTLSIVFMNSRRGFLTATAITVFIILRYFGIGNLLNLFLIAGISVAMDIYFSKQNK